MPYKSNDDKIEWRRRYYNLHNESLICSCGRTVCSQNLTKHKKTLIHKKILFPKLYTDEKTD